MLASTTACFARQSPANGRPTPAATTRVETSARPPADGAGLGRDHLLDGDLPPVTRVGEDDPADARRGAAREALARQRALREEEHVVGDVDDRLAGADQVPERAGARRRGG